MIQATVLPEGGPTGYTLGGELVGTALSSFLTSISVHSFGQCCLCAWKLREKDSRTARALWGLPMWEIPRKTGVSRERVVMPSSRGIRAV